MHVNGRGNGHVQPQAEHATTRPAADKKDAPTTWGWIDVRRWGIRPKLIVVVLIPTIAALLLGGLRMESALTTSAAYSRVGTLAHVLPQLDAFTGALQTERTLTDGYVAVSPRPEETDLLAARARTDSAVTTLRNALVSVDSSHDSSLQNKLSVMVRQLDTLATTRQIADTDNGAGFSLDADYNARVASVVAVTYELSTQKSDSDITRRVLGLQSLGSAKESTAQEQGIVYGALVAGTLSDAAYSNLVTADAEATNGVTGYLDGASPLEQAQYRTTVTGSAVGAVNAAVEAIGSARSVAGLGMSPAQWLTASNKQLALIATVETQQASAVIDRINSLGQSARADALTSAAIIYLLLGFALLATLLVARSILRPLRTLRGAALGVAYERLPETVRRLQDGTPQNGALDVAPIRITSTDEIGQVARAFDAVHTEAVHLAGQQALMRGNVNKMFINLSRRSQSLVERQLHLIDELEASEQDADQLANLFKLDHLATRMRRNDENLLVLAGDEGARRRSDPVPMLDVLRAASAEVEQYSRVNLDAQPGFELMGAAVNDVVHLLAELVENATTFSSPSTLVWLRTHSLGASGETMIEIEDHGIGMGPDELAAANDKLAKPSGMDVSMSRLMGLFVVGRLGQRHGITVTLRPSAYGGITAFVRLPAGLVSNPVAALGSAPEVVDAQATDPEISPIFDALQSEWFTRRRPAGVSMMNGTDHPQAAPIPVSADEEPPDWESPGDIGWRVAAALSTPGEQSEPSTPTGLPVRVPGRHLIPGSAVVPVPATAGVSAANGSANPGGLSSYQRGIHRARSGEEDTGAQP